MSYQSFTLADMEPLAVYSLLTNIVVPRPIALVSTVSESGVRNLAPFSYFNLGGSQPPSVVISIGTLPDQREKDSLRNIKETGEYVVNMVLMDSVEKMNITSVGFESDIDEWERSGYQGVESECVAPERVLECPIHMECRLFEIVSHGHMPGSANYVIGEVVKAHVSTDWADRLDEFAPISRLGGPNYLDLNSGNRFSLERPTF